MWEGSYLQSPAVGGGGQRGGLVPGRRAVWLWHVLEQPAKLINCFRGKRFLLSWRQDTLEEGRGPFRPDLGHVFQETFKGRGYYLHVLRA